MPRYIVERTFADGLRIPMNDQGANACASVMENNAKSGVTWVHSYVSEELRKTYCVYDGPTPEAIRETAESNNLPIDKIIAVSVLDPNFYRS
jgi:predicted amidohydrolase YtcJ